MGSSRYPRTVAIVALVALAAAVPLLGWHLVAPAEIKPADPGPETPAFEPPWERRAPIDDSGFIAAQQFWLPVTEPLSMAHLRDCYWHAGRRGIPVYQRQLSRGDLSPGQHMNTLFLLTCLHLYEGQFIEAGVVV